MPYIAQEKRHQLDPAIEQLHKILVDMELDDVEDNNMEGNMNYIFTRLLMMVYGTKDSTRYTQINDAMGVLACVSQEYYRKVAAPYEDQKEFDNGEIVPFRGEPEVVGSVTVDPADVTEEVVQTMTGMLDALGTAMDRHLDHMKERGKPIGHRDKDDD